MDFVTFFLNTTKGDFDTVARKGYQREMELKKNPFSDKMDEFSMSVSDAQTALGGMDVMTRALYAAKYIFWASHMAMFKDPAFDARTAFKITVGRFAYLAHAQVGHDAIPPLVEKATKSIYETMLARKSMQMYGAMAQGNGKVN